MNYCTMYVEYFSHRRVDCHGTYKNITHVWETFIESSTDRENKDWSLRHSRKFVWEPVLFHKSSTNTKGITPRMLENKSVHRCIDLVHSTDKQWDHTTSRKYQWDLRRSIRWILFSASVEEQITTQGRDVFTLAGKYSRRLYVQHLYGRE